MKDNGTIFNTFTDEVMADIDVFHLGMVHRIFGKELSPPIVNEKSGRQVDILLEFTQELSEPDGLFGGFSGCDIFCFSGGLGDGGLQSQAPRDGASGK